MAEQLQNLMHTRQELAAMDERNRLARDLHDSVKQQVFAAAMKLGAARELIDQDSREARRRLDEAEGLVRQAQNELTAIIRELHPGTLESNGLVVALKELVAEWSRLNKISANVHISDEYNLPKEIERPLFRVIQEALSNIARHSQASQIGLEMVCEHKELLIRLSDNGKGFDVAVAEGRGVGLRSMRERVEALGGDFSVSSNPGDGTRVTVRCRISDVD
jgi:NarL family two-component system sensor histidine kinase LiaS